MGDTDYGWEELEGTSMTPNGGQTDFLQDPISGTEDWETVHERERAQTVLSSETTTERNERNRRAVIQEEAGPADLLTGRTTDIAVALQIAEANRGTPHPARSELITQWKQSTRARLAFLNENFGDDATILGHLLFKIPPLAIRIKKGNITYRWKCLRTKESIAVKSGNGEAWIEIDLAFIGLQQINESLGGLITLWKKSPICFVENKYIRENMIPEHEEESMALTLESLIIDAQAGHPDLVWATAITRWFNYKPYSQTFYYRRDWTPINDPQDDRTSSQNEILPPSEITTLSGSSVSRGLDVGQSNPTTHNVRSIVPGSSHIVDLSLLETPGLISASSPVEAELAYPTFTQDPADPFIEPTSPVVYPFNSRPFMDYITSGPDTSNRITEWNDNVRFNWKTFERRIVPQFWRRNLQTPPEVVLPAPPSRNDAAADERPVTPDGNRDIILFMGDSIMVGLLNCTESNSTTGPIRFNGNTRFRAYPNFQMYTLAKVSQKSDVLAGANYWGRAKSSADLKVSGGASLSRVAGIVIHCGINDGDTGPNIIALQTIMREAADAGVTHIVLLPLPPEGDAPNHAPPLTSALSWHTTYMAQANTFHQSMVQLAQTIPRSIGPQRIDTHSVMTEHASVDEYLSGRTLPLKYDYMSVSGSTYNIHPNPSGYNALARFVRGHLPWARATTATASESDLWRVIGVEDGDTVFVCNNSGLRTIRMQHIDALETGHSPTVYNMPPSSMYTSEEIAAWLPDGQDSWRVSGHRWGEAAKNALIELTGYGGSNPTVRIEFNGQDTYGRYLGVLFKGSTNINLELVTRGLVFAATGSDTGSIGGEYESAMLRAGGPGSEMRDGKRGMWADHDQELFGFPADMPEAIKDEVRRLLYPWDFRRTYPFGGFQETGRSSTPTCPGT